MKWEADKKHFHSQQYQMCLFISKINKWTATSEFGPYRLCEQRRFRRACASAQSRQNLRCSLIQAVSQEEPSDRKPDLWPLWMAGHAQLKFVMTECSKTQIRLTGPKWNIKSVKFLLHLSIYIRSHSHRKQQPNNQLPSNSCHAVHMLQSHDTTLMVLSYSKSDK